MKFSIASFSIFSMTFTRKTVLKQKCCTPIFIRYHQVKTPRLWPSVGKIAAGKQFTRLCLVLALLLTPPLKGEVPAFIRGCMDCHGENGISQQNDVPTIAGLSAAYHKASLYAYRNRQRPAVPSKYRLGDQDRPSTDMKTISDRLTDREITYISLYFAAQRFIPAKQNFNPLLVEQGEKIHRTYCQRCHKDRGSRAGDDSGLLAGQWSGYLNNTMKFYRNGSREMEKKMAVMLAKISEQEWQALLAYYASQR
ncbi:c-type cytochrome [Thalassomonas viridans]|uniref:C-type cytochrome n=1 Tax=Thalassomonas viridans TaxID=137584 RepID=A0AAF0C5T3_9GAMM|nr:c-type cytochrome [Thalassomonas viridans]WDE03657.1 c-type cytochrome [Thalassomonas viridans]